MPSTIAIIKKCHIQNRYSKTDINCCFKKHYPSTGETLPTQHYSLAQADSPLPLAALCEILLTFQFSRLIAVDFAPPPE
jgi:hypothetical protein